MASLDTSLNPCHMNVTVPVTELYTAVREEQLEELQVILDGIDLGRVDVVSQCHLLHTAASYGRVRTVRLLVTRYKWPVNCRNESNQTPLHVACGSGYLDAIRVFVEYKADLKAHDKDNDTPLHVAATHGHMNVIDCLIDEFKCDPGTAGCEGRTILHYACYQGHMVLVKLLLSKYQMNPLSNDNNGNNSLHYAVQGGRDMIVKTLTNNYHDLHMAMDCRNKYIQSPLDVACSSGHLKIAKAFVVNYGLKKPHYDDNLLCVAARYGQTNTVSFLIDEFRYSIKGRKGAAIVQLACCERQVEVVEMLLTRYKSSLMGNSSIADIRGTDGCTLLHFACQEEHLELVEQLVTDYKLDPMIGDDNGSTPLHYAALDGRTEVATLLITKYGSPVNQLNDKIETPLHLACTKGHLTFIRMLVIKYKADINTCDMNNHTPLQRAVLSGHAEVVECFIKEFNCSADVKGTDGCSLLHLACQGGLSELVEELVTDYKLDPMIGDDNGSTPLHYAALGGKTEVATLLITKYGSPVNQLNNKIETPLHLACTKGHLTFIRMLVIKYKADINTCDMNNHTPLQRAVLSGQGEVVECFIKDFKCSADVKGTDGCSLLHLACQQGHLELVEILVSDYNIDPLIGDDNGSTPLHYAALDGKTEVATLLITKYGYPVNHLNNNNETPLHLACTKGNLTFIQTLVTEHRAGINTHDIYNDTPLQRAALSGQTKVVCLLTLEFSCDPKVTGVQGRNLLHYACVNGHDELARTLVSTFSLSLVSADVDGNTPLHISAIFGQNKCVRMLLYDFDAPVYLRNTSGKSALEVAKDGVTRSIFETFLKEEHNRIQYDYKEVQGLSKKKYSGAQRLTRVFVLGNVQSGKSTLIESLKRQGFFSSFNQVSEATVPPHTSGIIPSEYCHKTIGRVLYYDFAGDPEYYSSHSAIMSSVMQSKGTNICLILVNYQKDNKCIHEELGYWFGFISYHCTKLKENCKVLTIGSHIDLITKDEAKKKAALVSEFIENYLSHASKVSIEVVKSKSDLIINCCKPRSSSSVHSTLNQLVRGASTFRLSEEAAILLGLLEKDFKNVVTCKIQTLLTHIMQTGVYLPNTANSLHPTLMELHTIGLLLIIESMSGKLEDHLLLLNVPKLTNEVHKLLFSKDSAERNVSAIHLHSASMGILPQTYLIKSILPEYITTECLVQLQYCQEFSHAEVKFDYSVVPAEDSSAPKLLYFPALCKTERKESIKTPDDYNYSISWYLRCGEVLNYLPPRFLHVLLLRLAHSFALPKAYDSSSIRDDVTATVQLYNRRCTMWKNGIHWLMEEGVECFVKIFQQQ